MMTHATGQTAFAHAKPLLLTARCLEFANKMPTWQSC